MFAISLLERRGDLGAGGRVPGAFYLGDFGHRLFLLRPVLLWPGATWARPKIRGLSSIQARCNLGQFLLAPLTIQNVKMKKRKKNEKGREKRNERAGQST